MKRIDAEVIIRALTVFSEKNIDFVDALLFAYHDVRGDQIATFDKKLIKRGQNHVYDP